VLENPKKMKLACLLLINIGNTGLKGARLMRKLIHFSGVLFLSILCLFMNAQTAGFQLPADLNPGPFTVGFSVEYHYDFSRTFGEPGKTESEIARPIQILIWYPAQTETDQEHMRVKEYLFLAATELDFSPPDEKRKYALIEEYGQMPMGKDKRLADSPLFQSALEKTTLAVKNANPLSGPFPLIIYGAGGGDQAFDNHVLCEYLASHGYIVASCPSFGYSSRQFGPDHIGIEAHIRDSEFVMGNLLVSENVDKNRVGAMGYSWGGMTSIFFAMRNCRVGALVSLDGSEHMTHRIETMKSFPFYRPRKLRAHSMHISAGGRSHDFGFYNGLKYTDAYHLHFPNLRHGYLGSRNVFLLINTREDVFSALKKYLSNGYAVICRYTLNFFDAYLKKEKKSLKFLQNSPEENGIQRGMMTIESRNASEIPPMDEDFFSIIQTRGVEEAFRLFTEIRKNDPTAVLFEEMEMNMLGYRYLNERKLEESIKLLKMNVETYPESWNTYDSLAEAYAANGDKEKAIANYEKSLELDPENTSAKEKIAKLKKK
jgi:tetratricopeptide (TPR) repeat protein